MGENDFTELVVAEGTGSTNDIAKTSLQALFSKQSKTNSKALPLSDVCFTLVRQIDVIKQSTKFLLKQLLMNGSAQGRNVARAMRYNEQLKSQITQLKQEHSTQRLQYEQLSNDLNNRLKARENTIRELNLKLQEKDKMLSQFRNIHSGGGGRMATPDGVLDADHFGSNNAARSSSHHAGGGNRLCDNLQEPSNSNMSSMAGAAAGSSSSTLLPYVAPPPPKPPLQGLIMKRSAQQAMQQQAFHSRRGPNMSSGVSVQSSITGISNIGGGRLGTTGGVGHGVLGMGRGPSVVAKRFGSSSAHSTGSNSLNSATPRVRDLSHSTAFLFSGGTVGNDTHSSNPVVGSSGGGGGQRSRLNKRRRVAEATPLGNHVMSPKTAFALNQGNYSANSRGQKW